MKAGDNADIVVFPLIYPSSIYIDNRCKDSDFLLIIGSSVDKLSVNPCFI
jgi:hypothetical protein